MSQLVAYASDDVVLKNLTVLAPERSPNTDAVDPFSGSNLVIEHLFAGVADDIAIKSGAINSPGEDLPSRNIDISNVDFHHGHGSPSAAEEVVLHLCTIVVAEVAGDVVAGAEVIGQPAELSILYRRGQARSVAIG